jgi:hypothetical protein
MISIPHKTKQFLVFCQSFDCGWRILFYFNQLANNDKLDWCSLLPNSKEPVGRGHLGFDKWAELHLNPFFGHFGTDFYSDWPFVYLNPQSTIFLNILDRYYLKNTNHQGYSKYNLTQNSIIYIIIV